VISSDLELETDAFDFIYEPISDPGGVCFTRESAEALSEQQHVLDTKEDFWNAGYSNSATYCGDAPGPPP